MSDEPQDIAEAFDEETTGSDPDVEGRMDVAVDEPYLVDEEQVTEPILDSGRHTATHTRSLTTMRSSRRRSMRARSTRSWTMARLALDSEDIGLVADDSDMSAEEAALHVVDITADPN